MNAPQRPAESAAAAVARVARAHAAAVDVESRFPAEAVAAMREARLLGALIPRELGGEGMTLAETASHVQQIARGCASSAMILAMHHIQVACIVEHALESPWQRDLARAIAEKQLLVASITSEVGIGGDMRSSLCAVAAEGDRFRLEKKAPTISYGAHADLYLVTSRTNPDAPASDQVLVAAYRDGSTLERTGVWNAMGMRGTCSEAFEFATEGSVDQILPAPFADIAAVSMVPVSHLLWAGVWTGIAVEAVSRARAFLRAAAQRKPGAPLPGAARLMEAAGLLQMMQARVTGLLEQREASRAGRPSAWPAGLALATTMNILKRDISEMCHQAVQQSLLVCGMAGYRNDTEYSMGRHLRDILSAQLMISNDRIAQTTGQLLLAQRADLGAF